MMKKSADETSENRQRGVELNPGKFSEYATPGYVAAGEQIARSHLRRQVVDRHRFQSTRTSTPFQPTHEHNQFSDNHIQCNTGRVHGQTDLI